MLRKLRLRFIISAMAAFGFVMLVLVIGINLLNYSVTKARQDETITGIMEYEQMKALKPEESIPMISEMPWADGPEADFTTRFFVVHCNREGSMIETFKEHISSMDYDTIRQYTEEIMSRDKERGYYEEYRYRVYDDESGYTIIFLNVSNTQRFIRSLGRISVIIAFISLLSVFLLILFFSGKAIRPFMKNIERQKQFITDAGHELKTPLTSISTSADILSMEYEDDEWIENIRKQAKRLTHLVNNLVALSRLDEVTPFPEKTQISLSEAAWETAEPFSALARAEGKSYVYHIEEGLRLLGDRNAIQQMLSILLDNAVRYFKKGGEIRLDIYQKHGRIYIEVFNTCEIQNNTEPDRLFDRFYRPDESRSAGTGGSGIGLSMAQAVAEAHGGKIKVSIMEGKAILFKVAI